MKQIITAAVLALAVSPGYAQDLSGWSDIFSPRQVLTAIVQYGIFAVRTQTNMTYSGLSIDPVENRATIYDVVITPVLGPHMHIAPAQVFRLSTVPDAAVGQHDHIIPKQHAHVA